MAPTTLTGWLEHTRRRKLALLSGCALVAWAVGATLSALTFGLIWVLLLPLVGCFSGPYHSQIAWSLGLAGGLAGLGLVDCCRASRDEMSIVILWLAREVFYIGPRWFLDGCRQARDAFRLAGLDVSLAAEILARLAARNKSVSGEEILGERTEVDWSVLSGRLVLLDGVIAFRADRSRITLAEPLRQRLRRLLPPTKPAPAPVAEEPAPPPPKVDPAQLGFCELLGVSPRASLTEIKSAYRRRVKECHPDRFSAVDDHSRDLAEEWTKALNAAYTALVAECSGRKNAAPN